MFFVKHAGCHETNLGFRKNNSARRRYFFASYRCDHRHHCQGLTIGIIVKAGKMAVDTATPLAVGRPMGEVKLSIQLLHLEAVRADLRL
jgi:hypothetical protein